MCDFFWYLWQTKHWNLEVSICVYLRDRRATCGLWNYLCLPVLTWEKAQLHVDTWTTCVYFCLLGEYLWALGLLVSTWPYLREGTATCEHLGYLCLPVFLWGKGKLHVDSGTTCVYPCLLEGRHSYMWTLGLLVSTCVYLREGTATCEHLDYLCRPVLTCGYFLNLWNDQLELHECSCCQHKCCDYLGMPSNLWGM